MTAKDNFLRECPGSTGDLARAIDATFRVTDPLLSLSVAFSTAAAMRSGRIKHHSCHANAYHCVIGPTGCGKTTAQNYGTQVLVEAGFKDVLCGDFTSEAALIHRLTTNPITYASFDEIGLALQNMAEDKGGNRREVFATILRAYTATNGALLGKQYSPRNGSGAQQMMAEKPLLSISGSSTPSAFFAGMTSRAASDGLLGRFFVWFVGNLDPRAKEREKKDFVCPESVAKNALDFANWDTELIRPVAADVAIEDKSLFTLILEKREREVRLESDENLRALIARGPELFIKLCLALCDSDAFLDKRKIVYADELLSYLYDTAWSQCEDALGRGKRADERLQVRAKFLSKIPKGEDNKISKTELHKRTRKLGLHSRERNDLLQELVESGEVVEFECDHDEYSNRKILFYFQP